MMSKRGQPWEPLPVDSDEAEKQDQLDESPAAVEFIDTGVNEPGDHSMPAS